MDRQTLPDDRIAALTEAVRAVARDEILPRFRRLSPDQIAAKSGPWDLVTEADRAAEAAIERAVAEILPGAAVVGEEAVEADPARLDRIAEADLCVIVDPIDGTANFAAGVAVFGVILAVVVRGETAWGLLYDPVLDDWMQARRGGGATYEAPGRAPVPLRTRAARPLEAAEALLPLDIWGRAARGDFLRSFAAVGQVRNLRCSCHEYRLLASGQADAMVSSPLKPWDHAAGQLVLHEAGGWSRVDGTGRYSPLQRTGRMVSAGSAAVGKAVLELLPPSL